MENNHGELTTYTYRVSDGELLVAPVGWGEGQNAHGTTWPAEAAAQEGLQEAAGQWDAAPGLLYGPVRLGGLVDGPWVSQDALGYEAGETNLYPYCYDAPASDDGKLYHDVPNTVFRGTGKRHGHLKTQKERSMPRLPIVRLVIVFFVGLVGSPSRQAAEYCSAKRSVGKVGQIIIVANEARSYDVIWKTIAIKPGDVIDHKALREAEKKLAALKLFIVDPKTGIRPTVTVVQPSRDSESKDILVRVQERAALKIFPSGQQQDFRKIASEPSMAKCSFKIFNRTNAPIRFADIRYHCGSAIYKASVTAKVLQPNEKGKIQVVLDTRRLWKLRISAIRVDVETAQGRKTFVLTVIANMKKNEK